MSHGGYTYTQLLFIYFFVLFFFGNDYKLDHNAIAGLGDKTVKV